MNIRVLFFGAARDAVEANQLDLALEEPATVSSAFQSLKTRFSKLERFGRSLLFAVNQEYATPDTQLKENDELAVFPPVSGGSQDFFELTKEPIDVGAVAGEDEEEKQRGQCEAAWLVILSLPEARSRRRRCRRTAKDLKLPKSG